MPTLDQLDHLYPGMAYVDDGTEKDSAVRWHGMNHLCCGARLWFCFSDFVDGLGHKVGYRSDGSAVWMLAFGVLDEVRVHLYFGWNLFRSRIAGQVDHFDFIIGIESD
jgi:hypothetical protein